MHRQKLLIIDDSPDIHELVQVWLTDEPVEFVSCYTGQEALQSVLCLRPDLILLDVDLPGYDGFEVCRQLKANAATADIPVVFLTGASSSEEKLKGLELGATDYIIKPFDPPELRARVRSSLNTRRLMDLLAKKATTLQESEERFRLLAENSSDIISRHRPDGVYLYVSPAATTILGYSPPEMLGRPLIEFVHQEDIETVVACYTMLRVSGNTGTVSFRFRRRDGEFVWLESTGRTLSSKVGSEIREIQASARDVSARKQMEFREQARAEVLEMIAQGRPLNEILRALIDVAERQEPQASAAGVMLSEGVLHHCAPNLPPAIASSIERQLYSLINRFGVLAAESKDQVVVCDLLNDPAWASLHAAVREQNLRSCWSVLIRSRHGGASGILIIFRRENIYTHH
jgi:PAS domain S-box-containing protein